MRIIKNVLTFCVALLVCGCIKNDIPYPIVKAYITSIEFENQKSVAINEDKREITVHFPEEVDLTTATITKIKVTDKSSVAPSIATLPMKVDLSKDFVFTLTTYQEYKWTIKAEQDIVRSFKVLGQIGGSVVNDETKTINVEVTKSTDLSAVTVVSAKLVASGGTVSPNPMTVTNFSAPVEFTVEAYGKSEIWTVVVTQSDFDVVTNQPSVWARHADLFGGILSGQSAVSGFEYKKDGDLQWSKLSGSNVTIEDGAISAKLVTEPNTKYQYRVYQGENVGSAVEFTTEEIYNIPNMSFEDWHTVKAGLIVKNKNDYRPWASGGTQFWANGNDGVAKSGKDGNVNATTDAVSGNAACLETIAVAIVDLAAGSLFTGDFITNISKPLESPKFGRPFVGRPTKLIGKYKYLPRPINVFENKPEMEGEMDRAHMYVKLEDWGANDIAPKDRPAEVTQIAYGEVVEYGEVAEYRQFEIVLDYKILDKKPTHIVIVFASSYYGDSYVGGTGTKLFIDDLEFVYE